MYNPLPQPHTYGIIGTGAIGGFYGAKLQQSGQEVHFLLHRDYDYVCQHGLVIKSIDGDFTLSQVNAYHDVTKMPKCDVVIVALKTTQNHLLPELLGKILKDNGVVILFQNGLGSEIEVAKIVGADRVMGCVCIICSDKVSPGTINHTDFSNIILAEYGVNYQVGGISKRMQQIAEDMNQAGIKTELMADLLLVRWQKLVWNIPFNGLSVVLNATTEEMISHPEIKSLAEDLMLEVALGAKSCDRVISNDFIAGMIEHTIKMKPYLPSMKIDYDRQRALEIESIFGYPLNLARAHGVELPKIAMLDQQLQFLDRKNRQ